MCGEECEHIVLVSTYAKAMPSNASIAQTMEIDHHMCQMPCMDKRSGVPHQTNVDKQAAKYLRAQATDLDNSSAKGRCPDTTCEYNNPDDDMTCRNTCVHELQSICFPAVQLKSPPYRTRQRRGPRTKREPT